MNVREKLKRNNSNPDCATTATYFILSGLLKPRHHSLYLLVAHKHHNVPGTQTEKRGHEAVKEIRPIKNVCRGRSITLGLQECIAYPL